MKRTIYLTDELNERIGEYLSSRPEKSFSLFVQEAVQEKLEAETPTDYDALLALAGIAQTDDQGLEHDLERLEDTVMMGVKTARDI